MHFRRRLLDRIKRCHALSREQYAALTAEERSPRRMDSFRIVDDLCAPPDKPLKTSESLQAWVRHWEPKIHPCTQDTMRPVSIGSWGARPYLIDESSSTDVRGAVSPGSFGGRGLGSYLLNSSFGM